MASKVEKAEGSALLVEILNRKTSQEIARGLFNEEEQRLLACLWKSDPSLFDLQSERGKEVERRFMVSHHGMPMWLRALQFFFHTFNGVMHRFCPEASREVTEEERDIYRASLVVLTSFCQINCDQLIGKRMPNVILIFFLTLHSWYKDVALFDRNGRGGLDKRFLLEIEGTFLQSGSFARCMSLLEMCATFGEETGFHLDRDELSEIFPGQRGMYDAYYKMKGLFTLMEAINEEMREDGPFTGVYVSMIAQASKLMVAIIRQHLVCGYLLHFHIMRRLFSEMISASVASHTTNMNQLVEQMEREGLFASDKPVDPGPKVKTLRAMTEDDWKEVRERLTEELRKFETFGKFIQRCAEEKCATCADKPMSTLFLACGHVFMCLECFEGEEAYNHGATCPLCKKVSEEVLTFPSPGSDQQ